MTEDKMVGWHHRLNGHEFEQAPGDGEGQGSLECCSPWGHKELDTTEQLNLLTDAVLLFVALYFTSITSHVHNWVLFLLWLCLFIFSGVISPLISSSNVGHLLAWGVHLSVSYIFAFRTVHEVLKAGILKWFAIPFCSEPHFVRTLHHDLSILDSPP